MEASRTAINLAIGALGVGVAYGVDALGVPALASSLLGLAVVVVALALRRRLQDRP